MRRQLGGNWHEGSVEVGGLRFTYQALVFGGGSAFGIDGGPVSKLAIWEGPFRTWGSEVYNFDRGLDFDSAPDGVLAAVLADAVA